MIKQLNSMSSMVRPTLQKSFHSSTQLSAKPMPKFDHDPQQYQVFYKIKYKIQSKHVVKI
jgi:hypothetical protein